MKKLLGFILLVFAFCATPTTANAQLTAVAMTRGSLSDSAIINTGTPSVTTRVLESREVVSVQVVVTKNSGTVAGRCECLGSLDGTNFVRIRGAGPTSTLDTLLLTNVSTVQSFVWTISPSKYLDYRVRCIGVGTMNARIQGYLLRRKNE